MITTVSLEGFVAALRAIPEEEFTDSRVLETVTNSRVPITELDPYLVWKPDRYTRGLVYRNELFEVIVLCWNVGQGSPVHDHAGQRCWMTLPQGRLEITNYAYKHGREIEFIDTEIVGEHESDIHIDQCSSVHQITNRCAWCEPAVSLQVYSRPFDNCYIYDLATGTRELKPMCFDTSGPLAEVFDNATSFDGAVAT
ncbi:MAG: cysteine dioxygenase family protein [Acidobacteriota bacterium]|nr:cysteine dioxygenase family protein [Acidobacteriota bacterium]